MAVPIKKESTTSALVGDEGLLLDTTTDNIAYTNETATLIFDLCDGQRSVDDIIELLQEAFPEAFEQIPMQVQSVLDTLVAHNIIEYA